MRRLDVTGRGSRPYERRAASTAATSGADGPKRRPNRPGARKRRKFGDRRSDSEDMNDVAAAASGSLSVTSRCSFVDGESLPSATEWEGRAGLALALSTVRPAGSAACTLDTEVSTA